MVQYYFRHYEFFSLPRSIVDQGKFPEVIAFKERCDGSFATNDHVHGTFENDVPAFALISLVEH